MPWFASEFTNIIGSISAIRDGYRATQFVWQNREILKDVLKFDGISFTDYINNLSGPAWKPSGMDWAFLGLDIGLDIYDSIQRGISPGGVAVGASLTVVKDIAIIYTSKGIVYGLTTLGTFICSGVGTVIGFAVGTLVVVVGSFFAGKWLDDKIDQFVDWLF